MILAMRPRPTTPSETARGRRPAAAAAALVLLALGLPIAEVASAPPAAAQSCGTTQPGVASLSVNTTTLPSDRGSTVVVRGSRYLTGLYPCGSSRFGGIYVFFGWVAPGGQWGPSHRNATNSNGQYGITYHYPGEGGSGETRDDGSGTLRLVSFTAGGLSGTETPFRMDAAGNWEATLNIAGPVYAWRDIVTGAGNSVDCRVFRCGVYTIGAHGVASASNEQFVPITFTGPPPPAAPAAPAPPPPAAGGTGVATPGARPAGAPAPRPVPGSPTAGTAAPTTAPAPGATTAPTTTAPAPESTTTAPSVAGASTPEPTRRSTTTVPGRDREEGAVDAEEASVRVDDGGSPVPWPALLLVALVVAGASTLLLRRRRGLAAAGVGDAADPGAGADVGTIDGDLLAATPPPYSAPAPPPHPSTTPPPYPSSTPPPPPGGAPPAHPTTSTEGDQP
jgi:hypothetical protein